MTEPAPVSVVAASRFGSTGELARELAAGLVDAGIQTELLDAADNPLPPAGQVILLTAIIWDRPIPPMRAWLKQHATAMAPRLLAVGVVCGAAGVREGGGLIYAGQFARRAGASDDVRRFALSGRIPARDRLAGWEWWALRAFAGVIRKPQLFDITPDLAGARRLGTELGARLAAAE